MSIYRFTDNKLGEWYLERLVRRAIEDVPILLKSLQKEVKMDYKNDMRIRYFEPNEGPGYYQQYVDGVWSRIPVVRDGGEDISDVAPGTGDVTDSATEGQEEADTEETAGAEKEPE